MWCAIREHREWTEIFFVFFFFLYFVDFAIAALAPVVAIGAVASDPDFAAAPPLVPLAPPVCAKPPAADNASAMAATGMISARIMELLQAAPSLRCASVLSPSR